MCLIRMLEVVALFKVKHTPQLHRIVEKFSFVELKMEIYCEIEMECFVGSLHSMVAIDKREVFTENFFFSELKSRIVDLNVF